MAGRGRGMVMPAWMAKQGPTPQDENNQGSMTNERPAHPTERVRGQYDDAKEDSRRDGKAEHRNSSSSRGTKRDRSPRQHRDRSRSRDRRRPSYHRRSSRDDYRSRSRDRRDSYSRRRYEDDRRGGYDRPPHKTTRVPRRQRKPSNFDVYPPGVTEENAAAYATQAILQHNMAALQGAVGPASFGGAPPPAAMIGMQRGNNTKVSADDISNHPTHTRHARRIYVGGLDEVQEEDLKVFFNEIVDKAMGETTPGGSVMSVYINRERHFAFVEMTTIELASACMHLDGISFRGTALKIRRPNDYNPSMVPANVAPLAKFNYAALGIVSTNVADGPEKVFVGGIPYHLSDDQVKELLQAFGDLKSFHLVRDSGSEVSKGYGFCEYADPAVTDKACEGLNNLPLGDKLLNVRRADSHSGTGEIAGQRALAGIAGPPRPTTVPTRVLILKNMVTPEELKDNEEYDDIVEDIKSECTNFGEIISMIVPRPEGEYGEEAVGNVFIEFAQVESAKSAFDDLHGRGFASRTVEADFLSEERYASKSLATPTTN